MSGEPFTCFCPLFNLQLCRMRENAPVATEPRDRQWALCLSVCGCGQRLVCNRSLSMAFTKFGHNNMPAKDSFFIFGNHTDGGRRWNGRILDSQILEGLAVGWIPKVAEAPYHITADLIAPLHLGLCAIVQLLSNA